MLKVLSLPTDVLETAAFPSSAVSLTAHSQQKGWKIYSTTMPKWKERLLLCPKFNPAGAELVSDFPWLKGSETKKTQVLNFISSLELESKNALREFLSISHNKYIWAINIFEQREGKEKGKKRKKRRCKITIDARLTLGQNWWNCWRILSLYKDPVLLPRSAGAWVICCLRLFYLVFHSGIIVLWLFMWILFHFFLHALLLFQLTALQHIPEAHPGCALRNPDYCNGKEQLWMKTVFLFKGEKERVGI